jgi:threonine dehydratase
MITRQHITAAHQRIAPHITRTPVMDVTLPGNAGPVTLKLEAFQYSGSFKARGAFNSLIGNDAAKASGVAAASGGNHGAAVAHAAQALGLKARIFVPSISSPVKVARIKSYGAEVVQDGANYAEALALCDAYIDQTGAVSVHAYNAEATLAGQGTLGLELEQQAPDTDTILIAVGGGGLIGGVAAWVEDRARVISVEPETCTALHSARAAGKPVKVEISGVAADSLGASQIGEMAFEIAAAHVDDCLLVPDDAIEAAQSWLWQTHRIMTEPGGAAVLAALLGGVYKPQDNEKVCAVICGANVDPAKFCI